jgi:hypothetical protein
LQVGVEVVELGITVYMSWQPPDTPVESHWNHNKQDEPQRRKKNAVEGSVPCIFDTGIREREKYQRSIRVIEGYGLHTSVPGTNGT